MQTVGFDAKLKHGQMGESLIARWLKSKGWAVLPVYEVEIGTGKGPRLFTPQRQLAAPDMLIYKANKALWIEAKHKTAFSLHRKTGQWVTGIDIRHYEHYCAIEDESPWPVWLLFLQRGGKAKDSPDESPAGLYGNELCALRLTESHRWSQYGHGGMVYWTEFSLKRLATLEELLTGDRP